MQHVTMEMDETGTPIGAHYMLASTRDWLRFGALYLNDGVALNGQRILLMLSSDGGVQFMPYHCSNVRASAEGMPICRQILSRHLPALCSGQRPATDYCEVVSFTHRSVS